MRCWVNTAPNIRSITLGQKTLKNVVGKLLNPLFSGRTKLKHFYIYNIAIYTGQVLWSLAASYLKFSKECEE
jgi:hypothetical protein